MSERTPEQREAARRERERRRAERAGRPLPPEPDLAPDWLRAEAASVAADPHATQRHEPAPPPEADRHATQQYDVSIDWTREHEALADPEPDPAPGQPAAPTPAMPPAGEVPLGTRRVSALAHRGRRGARVSRGGTGALSPGGANGFRTGGPPRSGHLRRRLAALAVIAVVLAAGWFLVSLYQPFAGDGSGRVAVKIPKGASASAIGDLLEREGVVSSSFFFGLRAQLSGVRGALRSGTFTLKHDMSYGAALDALTKVPPPPPVLKVTIPEGYTRAQIAKLAREDGLRGSYLRATRHSRLLDPRRSGGPRRATLEGFLFPATYELRPHAKVGSLVSLQIAAFREKFGSLDLSYARKKNLKPYDVLTIASMVEREVSVAKERPLVAAVIYNRLHQGMPLGIDATLRYALNDWTHPLTLSELASKTPYNTRNHQGLPPGPIGNPGLASLQAAAHPAKVPYLYYVVKPGTCGEHAFSSTDARFEKDVARYNAARKAAGGKSPEKC
jgi:UPF0755 protein